MSAAVRTFVTIALVTSAVLTGCGSTSSALPTPTAVVTPTATPDAPASPDAPSTPAPPTDPDPLPVANPIEQLPSGETEPPATPGPPPLATITVTTAGLGPLHLGAAVPGQASPTAMAIWDPTYCAGFPHPHGGSTGAFRANYPNALSPALGLRAPFTVITTGGEPNGTIGSVIVFTPEAATAAGVRVGSTRAELTAAYPEVSELRSAMLSDVYVIDGETGRLAFEVAKNPEPPLDGYWPSDVVDTVLWMMVVPPGTVAPTIAGSDAGGPCAI